MAARCAREDGNASTRDRTGKVLEIDEQRLFGRKDARNVGRALAQLLAGPVGKGADNGAVLSLVAPHEINDLVIQRRYWVRERCAYATDENTTENYE